MDSIIEVEKSLPDTLIIEESVENVVAEIATEIKVEVVDEKEAVVQVKDSETIDVEVTESSPAVIEVQDRGTQGPPGIGWV